MIPTPPLTSISAARSTSLEEKPAFSIFTRNIGPPFPEIWHPMPNPVDASQGSASVIALVLRPLHVHLSSPGNSRRACTPNPACFLPDSASALILPAPGDRNYLLCFSRNSRNRRLWVYVWFMIRQLLFTPGRQPSWQALPPRPVRARRGPRDI